MGMFDSFLDKVAECPKCHSKVTEWQTKMLQSLGDFWEKGDFVQYRQPNGVAEKKRTKKDDDTLLPLFRRDREYLSNAPLLFNGKVPVHISCKKCHAWLEGYANVLDGRFTGIVEVEAGVREKPPVLVKRETTAQTLRADYEIRLSHLQESCSHKKTKWMDVYWVPVHYYGRALVCLRCEKRLKIKQAGGDVHVLTPKEATELRSNIRRIRARK